jgi:hypothetical protein
MKAEEIRGTGQRASVGIVESVCIRAFTVVSEPNACRLELKRGTLFGDPCGALARLETRT